MIKIDKVKKERTRGWTKEQDEFLLKVFNNKDFSMEEICEAIGKSDRTVRSRAELLGLKPNRRHKPFAIEGMKLCPHCNEYLPFDAFVKNASKPNGIGSYCSVCDSLIKKTKRVKAKYIAKEERRKHIKEKKCTRCHVVKPIEDFYKIGGMCKICRNERNAEINFECLKERGYSK